jgi:hypothetical protein
MRTSIRLACIGMLTAFVLLLANPAQAQWFDNEEAPAGEGDILSPFTFKSFDFNPGGQVTSWIAPGDEILGLTFLIRGGYAFDSVPIYIGLELPLSWAQFDPGGGDKTSDFVLGNIGINFKSRLDPKDRYLANVFTGWSLDLYIPTFQGDFDPRNGTTSLGHVSGLSNTLLPGIHINQEAVSVVGTFDLIVPGNWVYFQFEVSAAAYFPVTSFDDRSIEGALLWGALAGINIAEPIAFMLELKAYTPLGVEEADGAAAPTFVAVSPGVRMRFGPFKPAVWVTFPISERYRQAWPDVIIGIDLAAWF